MRCSVIKYFYMQKVNTLKENSRTLFRIYILLKNSLSIYAITEYFERQISYDISFMWNLFKKGYGSVQSSSVSRVQLFVTPMNHRTPGHPVHHQLLEFTKTHIHRVSDAIQPSHPLSSHSPPAPNPSQHQSFLQ